MMTNFPHYFILPKRLSTEVSFHPFLEPVWRAVGLNIQCATCNHCLTVVVPLLKKMPFLPSGGNISRQSQTWPATPSAPRSSRPSSTEGVAPWRFSLGQALTPLLLRCVRTFSAFTETSTRTTTERWRRSASRSSWWSCPTSGPRRSTWRRSSVRASGRRNWDVCVCRGEHMPAIILIHLRQSWQTCVCLSAVLFNMHDTDNDGMITLEEYRHVSLCSDMKCCLRWSFQSEVLLYWFYCQ